MTGNGPRSLVVADVSKDGLLDVITTNSASHDISVLLGNGDGTFQQQMLFSTNEHPGSISAADINTDGNLDLVHRDQALSASILFGNGDGTFEPEFTFISGQAVISTTPGEFNEDGIPDIVIKTRNLRGVSVLLGNGDGSFQPKRTFGLVDEPIDVYVADVNTDGWQDIVTGDGNPTKSVSVLLGDGTGNFRRVITPVLSRLLVVTDIDRDGLVDIACLRSSDINVLAGGVTFFAGNGDGTFTEQKRLEVGVDPREMAVADFNRDGLTDVVITTGAPFRSISYPPPQVVRPGGVAVVLGKPGGGFESQAVLHVGTAPSNVAVVDLNADQVPDVLCLSGLFPEKGSLTTPSADVLLGNGDGTFQAAQKFPFFLRSSEMSVVDVSGDGWHDIITANGSFPGIAMLIGNGDGTFQPEQILGQFNLPRFVTADVNADGNADIVTDESVLLGNGDASFEVPLPFDLPSGRSGSLAVADVNGDRAPDVLTAHWIGVYELLVRLGNGDGTFKTPRIFPAGQGPSSIAVSDLNHDGLSDIATSNLRSNNISVYLNVGSDELFTSPTTFDTGFEPVSLASTDINGDGWIDLVTANRGSSDVSVLFGKGGGDFHPHQSFAVGYLPESVVVADMNLDGLQDIVAANGGSGTISILFQRENLNELKSRDSRLLN